MTAPLVGAVAEILRQGEALLHALDDEAYTRVVPQAFASTIGAHYRHCLDHFQCLAEGLQAGEINYDARRRDPRLETNRAFALAETRRLSSVLHLLAPDALAWPIEVRSKVSYRDGETQLIASTVGREVMYAVAHAIHHYALLSVMCALMGIRPPAGFGVAPSTLQHRATQVAA